MASNGAAESQTAGDKKVRPSEISAAQPGFDPWDKKHDHKQRNLQFDQIQGNSIGGFNKDSQAMLFLRFKAGQIPQAISKLGGNAPEATGVLADVCASSSEQVLRFNAQFKALRRQGVPEGTISATWTNIVFSPRGLQALGQNINRFPPAFRDGMAARASALGDIDSSNPAHWENIVAWDDVDLVLIVASDTPHEVDPTHTDGRVGQYLALIGEADSGLELATKDPTLHPELGPSTGQIYGKTRADQPGHEHFGFKDGVSQPAIRGVDAPDDPVGNPNQGNPGQDMLHPGEFILGYPRQQPQAKPNHEGLNPDPGIISGSGRVYDATDKAIDPVAPGQGLPAWADNGSFLVFRRLEQDVSGFHSFVKQQSQALQLTTDLMGAKLVGRYASGAPLEKRSFEAGDDTFESLPHDPGVALPALANSDTLNNNFEYGDDADGEIVPLAAHIRKAYPRDQVPANEFGQRGGEDDSESRVQTHRLLRRGIPYGNSLGVNNGGGPFERRGLLFLAYQTDIERQFEFVQKHWVNDADFPTQGAGQDPILSQRTAPDGNPTALSMCPYRSAAAKAAGKCPVSVNIQHFITTRGGGYYFSPSINALKLFFKVP